MGICHEIIPYVITWDGVVTNYHSKYLKELGVTQNIEAYIQIDICTTLEAISFEYRRSGTMDEETPEQVRETAMAAAIECT